HGEAEAAKAQEAARALFGSGAANASAPTTELPASDFESGMDILSLMLKAGLIPSKGEGRRLVTQGGVKLNGAKVEAFDRIVKTEDFENNELLIQKGKKVFHKIKIL
ncbi:MAG: tyrosine--tRNA ligase, partial [Firmicutes bacterium]|nr:tyrosine--tRNA ligase [Bacillota bacterium]